MIKLQPTVSNADPPEKEKYKKFNIILGILVLRILEGWWFSLEQCFWAFRILIRFWEILIQIMPSLSKNSKKNLDFYCFVTSLWLFIAEEWCKCRLPSKSSVISKTSLEKSYVGVLKVTDEKSRIRIRWSEVRYGSADSDPYRGYQTKMLQIQITAPEWLQPFRESIQL